MSSLGSSCPRNCLEPIPCKRYWLSTSPHGVTSGKTVFSMVPLWETPVSRSTHSVFPGGQSLETPFFLLWRFSCLGPPIPLQFLNFGSRSGREFCWHLFSMTCRKSSFVRGNLSSKKKAGLRLQHFMLMFRPDRSRFTLFDIFCIFCHITSVRCS